MLTTGIKGLKQQQINLDIADSFVREITNNYSVSEQDEIIKSVILQMLNFREMEVKEQSERLEFVTEHLNVLNNSLETINKIGLTITNGK